MLRYLGIIILTLGVLGALALWPEEAPEDFTTREKAIISQAKQRDWPVVVFGDSVTELAVLPDVCGQPTLNAGIAGQKASGLERVAAETLRHIDPELVILALGTNDAWDGRTTDRATFIATMRRLIDLAEKDGARVLLIKPGEVSGFGKGYVFDNTRIRAIGDDLETLGTATGPIPPLTNETSDDGVHPNAAGYRQWTALLDDACEAHDKPN